MLRILTQALKIATIAVLAGLVVFGASGFFRDTLDSARGAEGVGDAVTITIRKTDDVDSVAKKLHDAGLIQYEVVFKTRLRLVSADIAPGKYRLEKGMSIATIVDIITTAKTASSATEAPNAADLTLTVPEGWRTEQIAEELDRIGYQAGGKAFLAAAKSYPSDNYDFLADRPDPQSLEGYLFPDTYTFTADASPEKVIALMLDNFDLKFGPELRQRAADMNLSVPQVLAFASLVEREAGNDRERPVIADVYISRWEQGWTLDADPAVRYALGNRNGDWWTGLTGSDIQNLDSPYNLYKVADLPPTPICNPSINSIYAVLQPAATDYMYFVAKADGSGHYFAVDLDSQTQNINYVAGDADAPAPCSEPWDSGCPLGGSNGDSSGEVPIQQTDG